MPKIIEFSSSFRAMNTEVMVIICGADQERRQAEDALVKIKESFLKVEATLTRFNLESELSRLNAASGEPFIASEMLFEVVKAALQAAGLTGGIFDPTLLSKLVRAGYDRSFEKLPQKRPILSEQSQLNKKAGWQDVFMDESSSVIRLPQGIQLDLGGIGKGWTVDQVCLILKNFPGYAVDAGGDIKVLGRQSDGSAWTVAVDDPFIEGHDLAELHLTGGAICTSTSARRRWQMGETWKHHLIDPRTGEPANSGVVSATVAAETAMTAEIIAKTALILGPEAGRQFVQSQPGAKGLLILEDGRKMQSGGFEALLKTT